MTAADKAKLTPQQNRLSNAIYRDKHNGINQPPVNGEVNTRDRMQQERIGQGIKVGSLTAGEAANLEHKEAALNREQRAMRATNGGRLSSGQKAVVNQQQNAMSRQIYNKKHNGRTQK